MLRRIKLITNGVTFCLKELEPYGTELCCFRLSPYDNSCNYDLLIVATNIQPTASFKRTHRLSIEKIYHGSKDNSTIIDLAFNLLSQDLDLDRPHDKAWRVVYRLAYWIALAIPDDGYSLGQSIDKFDWMAAIHYCAADELGTNHQIMP